MALNSIEIMCIPCPKCGNLKTKIKDIINTIEMTNKVKINCVITHTPNLSNVSQYSTNAAQTPIIIVNGQVEFAGVVEIPLIRKKLEFIHRCG